MSPIMKSVIKSYMRGVIVAITPLLMTNQTDPKIYLFAVIAGVVSPALRAVDKNDPAFGRLADQADVEIDKLLKAEVTKKKAAPKKKAK
jgi:hypothetical protein